MRRAGVAAERHGDGSWTIGYDHLAKAEEFARRDLRNRSVTLTQLSRSPVTELAVADASTWLDRELAAGSPTLMRDAGFGREVRTAMAARRQWLIEQQIGVDEGGGLRLRDDALARLGQRELQHAGEGLAREFGKTYSPA